MRGLALFGVGLVAARRGLRLPSRALPPGPLRSVDRHWTRRMVRDFLRSGGARLPVDQPCALQPPDRFPPRAEVEPAHRLTEPEIRRFYSDGFLPPFDVFDDEAVRTLRETLMETRGRASAVYGFVTDRDRHLDTPAMLEAMAHPAITDRLAQLLGPDLVCWRSQIFCKPPGGAAIQWHQASTYMMEDSFLAPVLVPRNRDRLFQLTVWIPLVRVTRSNGCLRFLTGSQDRMHTIRLGGRSGFYEASYAFECDIDEDRVVDVEMGPGQALIFSERTVHGSDANETDQPRLAFNYRVVTPEVEVYPGPKLEHEAVHMGEKYDLRQWRAVILRGDETCGDERTVWWRAQLD
ncbi:MAG: phytanoyl-CoA dioxygenase family protein [Planctomycetota bacterium]